MYMYKGIGLFWFFGFVLICEEMSLAWINFFFRFLVDD